LQARDAGFLSPGDKGQQFNQENSPRRNAFIRIPAGEVCPAHLRSTRRHSKQELLRNKLVEKIDGKVSDPYSMLPPVFRHLPCEVLETSDPDADVAIAEGGAATLAYARLQFEDLPPQSEREATKESLLRYCELDTLAMVMVYEAWREWYLA